MVDRDGESTRKGLLARHVVGVAHPHVIAVAVEAFESWLAVVENAPDAVPASEIKQRVSRSREQRIAIAKTMDLTRHLAKSPSLAELHGELKRIVPELLEGR